MKFITKVSQCFRSFITTPSDNFVAILRISDDIMSNEDWPLCTITVKTGVVIVQHLLYAGNLHSFPDMRGWGVEDLVMWVNVKSQEDGLNTKNEILYL